jgi:hypothetical protein
MQIRSKMTVNELNREHPGMFYVDENGSVQQIKEKVVSGGGAGAREPKPMTFKDSLSNANELFASFGIENPQQTNIFNKILGLIRSDNYEGAQATLRVYALAKNAWPKGVRG